MKQQLPNVISTTIQEQIYNILKRDIIDGVYQEGEQLKEIDLSERFQVSRSPIREALRRLAGDGILVMQPNRGIFVREFSPKYIYDVMDLRIMLEKRGIEQAPFPFEPSLENKLSNMRVQIEYLIGKNAPLEEHESLDKAFHSVIMGFNNNEFISEMAGKIETLNAMFQRLSLSNPDRATESQQEHLQLLDCLLCGDREKAVDINSEHIRRTQHRVFEVLQRRRGIGI